MRTWKWVTRMLDVSCFWQRSVLSSHIMSMLISSWQGCKFFTCELFFWFLPECVWVPLGFSATRWCEYTGVTGVLHESNSYHDHIPGYSQLLISGFSISPAESALVQHIVAFVKSHLSMTLPDMFYKYGSSSIDVCSLLFCACFLSASSSCPSSEKINTVWLPGAQQ